MRIAVSTEQKKFFLSKGYIEFENLLLPEDNQFLLKEIARIRKETPGHLENNLYRSIPSLLPLLRKRQVGEITYELVGRKPVRLEYDRFFSKLPEVNLEEEPLGLLLFLQDSTRAVFFKNSLQNDMYKDTPSCYLLVLTTKALSNDLNPILFS